MDNNNLVKGVREGDVISSELFTNLLEYKFLNDLRFADVIIFRAERIDETRKMLEDPHTECKKVGLRINFDKIQFMTNMVLSESKLKNVFESDIAMRLKRKVY